MGKKKVVLKRITDRRHLNQTSQQRGLSVFKKFLEYLILTGYSGIICIIPPNEPGYEDNHVIEMCNVPIGSYNSRYLEAMKNRPRTQYIGKDHLYNEIFATKNLEFRITPRKMNRKDDDDDSDEVSPHDQYIQNDPSGNLTYNLYKSDEDDSSISPSQSKLPNQPNGIQRNGNNQVYNLMSLANMNLSSDPVPLSKQVGYIKKNYKKNGIKKRRRRLNVY